MAPLLDIQSLGVTYRTPHGTAHAVRNVSFTMEAGSTCALVGESGCGKSVTAKSIMGLVRQPGHIDPASRVLFEGVNVLDFSQRQWEAFRGRDCAMVFQDALVSLNPTLKIKHQVGEVLDNHEPGLSVGQKRARALEMLALTHIADPQECLERYPHELSGGMRQRVMIAAAMMGHPKLLIADEPTTSLDVTVQAQTLSVMKDLQNRWKTGILLITHDLGIVAGIADTVVVMYAGQVVEQGPCDSVFYRPGHPYTRALLSAVPHLDAPAKHGLQAIEGTLPNPTAPHRGCPFCSRCPHAMNLCASLDAPWYTCGPNHTARCWLHNDRCPRKASS